MAKKPGGRVARASLEQTRELAVRMLAAGVSPGQVAEVLGCGRSTVYKWAGLARSVGLSVKRGKGRRPRLGGEMIARLGALLCRDPRQLAFDFGLWTRQMVQELIRREFDVELSIWAVGALLRDRLGMSPQKPLYRAWQQKPQAVEAWKREVFPSIVARAKKEKATIWFGDECGVRSDYHAGTTWAPIGQTPTVVATGKRTSVNMLSAVNARGQLHFRLLESGGVSAEAFIDYLQALLADVPGRIFLVLDRHPAHVAKATQAFVASVADRLELFFLPGYSPQLNPDEWVWKNVKHDHAGKAAVMGEPELRSILARALRRLQTLPGLIRSIFCDPNLAYIKASLQIH
jgi:transposase